MTTCPRSRLPFEAGERVLCSGQVYGLYPAAGTLFVNARTMIVLPLYKRVNLSRCSNSIRWPETVGQCCVSRCCRYLTFYRTTRLSRHSRNAGITDTWRGQFRCLFPSRFSYVTPTYFTRPRNNHLSRRLTLNYTPYPLTLRHPFPITCLYRPFNRFSNVDASYELFNTCREIN